MNSIRAARRATSDTSMKRLALPPGFRRLFQNQSGEVRKTELNYGSAVSLSPIQISDVDSPDFGEFVFLTGYDEI